MTGFFDQLRAPMAGPGATDPSTPDFTALALHQPKREFFDLAAGTNTDPKGVVRPVDEFHTTAAGLYMARSADHPRFDYVESWLLPTLDLRVTDFHFTAGNEMAQEFYVDIMTIDGEPGSPVWSTVDLYLDIICCPGSFTETLDIDEFVAATARGVLDEPTAHRAMSAAVRAATGIAACGHDLRTWLRTQDVEVHWRRR